MTYFDPGNGEHVVVNGMIVDRDCLRVVEAIKDYDDNIEVLCNTEDTEINEAPYIICERVYDPSTGGQKLVRIFEAWQLDDRVLDRIRLSDTNATDILGTLASMQSEIDKKLEARYKDWMGEQQDVVKHIAGIKSSYTWRDDLTGDIVTFYDDRPATRMNGTKVF